jgi:hypothetical protein
LTIHRVINDMLRTFWSLFDESILFGEPICLRRDLIETEGCVMNPSVGMEYRKMVLAPGGTHNIADHFLTKFLGRTPSNEAFLKSRGVPKKRKNYIDRESIAQIIVVVSVPSKNNLWVSLV